MTIRKIQHTNRQNFIYLPERDGTDLLGWKQGEELLVEVDMKKKQIILKRLGDE